MSNEKKLITPKEIIEFIDSKLIGPVVPIPTERDAIMMIEDYVAQQNAKKTFDLQKRIKELEDEKNLLTDSMKLIISKRTSIGWDSECSALVAEETLKKVK